MAEFVGSSGTLVGASLETAGYFYQSWLLDALGDPGIHAIGSLLYIIGALVAVFTFVIVGNFKLSGWLLVGPGLFFSMVIPREATKGADWIFGGEPRDRQQLQQQIDQYATANGGAYEPQVSSLFAVYNDIVSSSVREIVAALNGQRQKTDMRFLFRAQLYGYMVSPVLKDPGLRELLHLSLLGRCRDMIEAGREMADEKNGDTVRTQWREKYDDIANNHYFQLPHQAAAYLASFKVDYPSVFSQIYVSTPQQEIANQQSGCHNPGGNCPNPPGSIDAAVQAMRTVEQQWAAQYGSVPRNPDDPNYLAFKAQLDARAAQVTQAAAELESKSYTCTDIWNFAYLGINIEAVRTLEQSIKLARERGQMTDDEINAMLREFFGQSDEQHVYRSIAKRLLSNEFYEGSVSSIIQDYSEKGTRIRDLGVAAESPLAQTERNRTNNRLWAERTKFLTTASAMPYYQGLALYFLAVAYPFFAFLLLIPGKHGGFVLWFALWFWAKSWDIGFAAVMLLDDVLYSLFVVNNNPTGDERSKQLSNDLSVAILSLREGDPSFNLSTYYSIVAIALHAVPMIMSYIVMAGVTGGVGLIAAGMGRWSGVAGGSFGSGGGLSQASQMGQSQFQIDSNRSQALDSVYRRSQSYSNFARDSSAGVGGNGVATNDFATSYGQRLGHESAGIRKGNSLGMTGGQMVDAAATAGRMSGTFDGTRTTLIGKLNPWNAARGSRRQLNRVRDAIADAGTILGDAAADAMLSLARGRYAAATSWAKYDGFASREVQNLAEIGRTYDMFEIPWAFNDGGWKDEYDQYIDEMVQAASMAKASADAANKLIAAYGSKDAKLRGSLMGTGASAALLGLGYLNKESGLGNYTSTAPDSELLDPTIRGIRDVVNPDDRSGVTLDTIKAAGWDAPRDRLFGGNAQEEFLRMNGNGNPSGQVHVTGSMPAFIAGTALYQGGGPSTGFGMPSFAPASPQIGYANPGDPGTGEPRVAYGYPQTHYGQPNYERGGDPYYDRGGDPTYERGIERIHPLAIDALSDHEGRLASKADRGEMDRGKASDTRLAYGDPDVESTEMVIRSAHNRLEARVAELRARGVSGDDLEEAERLMDSMHSSEASYDSALAAVDRAQSQRDRSHRA